MSSWFFDGNSFKNKNNLPLFSMMKLCNLKLIFNHIQVETSFCYQNSDSNNIILWNELEDFISKIPVDSKIRLRWY